MDASAEAMPAKAFQAWLSAAAAVATSCCDCGAGWVGGGVGQRAGPLGLIVIGITGVGGGAGCDVGAGVCGVCTTGGAVSTGGA